jgi:hypothetical protein
MRLWNAEYSQVGPLPARHIELLQCLHQADRSERAKLIAAALLPVLAGPVADGIGLVLVITVVAKQELRKS